VFPTPKQRISTAPTRTNTRLVPFSHSPLTIQRASEHSRREETHDTQLNLHNCCVVECLHCLRAGPKTRACAIPRVANVAALASGRQAMRRFSLSRPQTEMAGIRPSTNHSLFRKNQHTHPTPSTSPDAVGALPSCPALVELSAGWQGPCVPKRLQYTATHGTLRGENHDTLLDSTVQYPVPSETGFASRASHGIRAVHVRQRQQHTAQATCSLLPSAHPVTQPQGR